MEGGGERFGEGDAAGLGGSVRYVTPAIEALSERGHEIIFGTTRPPGPLNSAVEEQGIRVFDLDCSSARSYPQSCLRLAGIIRRERPSIVHLMEPIQAVIGGVAVALARQGTSIFHRHHAARMPGAMAGFSRVGAKLCDRVMAVSHAAAQGAEEDDRVDPGSICVAENGIVAPRPVDATTIEAMRKNLGIESATSVVVSVGHLRPEKGHHLLIEALEQMDARTRPQAVIVGDGPLHDDLSRRAKRASASISLVGHQDDVWPWLALGDVVVVPSLAEGFGLVAVEGMASRKPVIAAAVGGLLEIAGDEGALALFAPGDPTSLAERLRDVLGDADAGERFASKGFQRYRESYTVQAMVDRWADCYRRALEVGRHR